MYVFQLHVRMYGRDYLWLKIIRILISLLDANIRQYDRSVSNKFVHHSQHIVFTSFKQINIKIRLQYSTDKLLIMTRNCNGIFSREMKE